MKSDRDIPIMRRALRLAQRGYGSTFPNPMVGAVLVKAGEVIGDGWHHRAGERHAEIEAIRDAEKRGHKVRGAMLYVTLEPCCSHGRTPPCTDAIIAAGIKRVVAGMTDPNPKHSGRGFEILKKAGLQVTSSVLAAQCVELNEAFNHWIVCRTPFVTVKAAMTLDGKIATASGESKWITGDAAREFGMKLRQEADAVLVGINTVLADDPRLTIRARGERRTGQVISHQSSVTSRQPRRIVLDSSARTPLDSQIVSDDFAGLTTLVVKEGAPKNRVAALAKRVNVLVAPSRPTRGLDLPWLLARFGAEDVTSLLVEGGGEVNASFLMNGLAQRIAFFYAPKILGGRDARKGVGGEGARTLEESLNLTDLEWKRLGADWLLTARVTASL